MANVSLFSFFFSFFLPLSCSSCTRDGNLILLPHPLVAFSFLLIRQKSWVVACLVTLRFCFLVCYFFTFMHSNRRWLWWWRWWCWGPPLLSWRRRRQQQWQRGGGCLLAVPPPSKAIIPIGYCFLFRLPYLQIVHLLIASCQVTVFASHQKTGSLHHNRKEWILAL